MSTSQLTRSFSDSTYPMTDEDRIDKSLTMDSEKINALEKENDLLTKKAHKRLSRKNRVTNEPKGFISTVFRWHRKRKLGKIKVLLNSLFPKLTESENVASKWLREVSDKKEIVWQNGNIMLHDMESQIDVYQSHLDFVDDVINDIKQLDYDVFKEINDIKAAFAFSQEIVEKQSKPTASNSKTNLVSLDTNTTKALNLHEADHSHVGNLSAVFSAARSCCQDTEIKRPSVPTASVIKSINSNSNISTGVVCHTPATWQGLKASKPMHYAKSVFTKSLGESADTTTEETNKYSSPDDVYTDSAAESSSSSDSSSSSNTNAATVTGCCSSNAMAFLDPCSAACVWDGADYKRRSLQNVSVSLATLQPQSNPSSPSNKSRNSNSNDSNNSGNLISRLFNSKSSSPINRHHRSNSISNSNITSNLTPSSANKRSVSNDGSPINSTTTKLGFLSRSNSRSQSHRSSLLESDSEDNDHRNTNSIRYSSTTHKTPAQITTCSNKVSSVRSNSRQSSSGNTSKESKPRSISTPHSTSITLNKNNSNAISEVEKIRSYSSASSSASSEELNSSTSSETHPPSNTTTKQPTTPTSSKHKNTESKSLTVMALLKQIDCKDYSSEQQVVDEDQVEMLRRIEKCLLVKESLKSILMTMELTREKEMTTLRGVKRMKNNLKEVISLHDAQIDQKRPPSQTCAPQLDLPSFLLQSSSANFVSTAPLVSSDQTQQDNRPGDNIVVYLDNQNSYSYDSSTPNSNNHIGSSCSGSGTTVNSTNSSHQHQSSCLKSSCEDSFINSGSSASSTPYSMEKRGLQPDLLHHCLSEASECVENLSKLVTEENEARDAVAKLTSLINNVQIISKELAEELDLVNEDMLTFKIPVTPSGGLTVNSDMN